MEEKVLIKSEKMNTANFLLKWFAIASAIVFAVIIIVSIVEFTSGYYSYGYSRYDLGEPYEFDISYIFASVVIGAFLTIPAIIIYFEYKRIELIVTDKRVYGIAAFSKRVDLPMDSISAIGTSIFKGIGISTASGRIKFAFIKNRDDIQKVLSKQLINRQNKKQIANDINIEEKSNIEELKQYKELLDANIINQEEFENKKKELLN